MESVFLVTAVVGFVELVKALEARNYRTVIIIVGAGLIGAIVGYFGIEGLTVTTGIIAGLSASGVYKVGSEVGNR